MRLPLPIRLALPLELKFHDLERLSDTEVMACLKAGNHDALAVLFDRYHRLVGSIAGRILRDPVEAEDVKQNVFIEIMRAVGQFDASKGTVKVWIMQYARHRSFNRRQQLEASCYYDDVGLASLEQMAVGAPGWGILSREESRRLVHEALSMLTDKQRTAVELVCYEGRTMNEVAEKMEETTSNACHHYYRGLEKMRVFLSGDKATTMAPAKSREAIDAGA